MELSRTAKQWLIESLGWTAGTLCALVLWCMFWLPAAGMVGLRICLGSAVGVHGLIWWKALGSIWQQETEQDAPAWLALAKIWLRLLVLFQVWCLYVLLGILWLLFGADDGSSWGSPNIH